jgi:hypothetical protein
VVASRKSVFSIIRKFSSIDRESKEAFECDAELRIFFGEMNHFLIFNTSRRSCHRSFQILFFLDDQARFFFILDTRQGSCLDLTARILPDFQEYKILDRTDKSCPASQDSVHMILGWQGTICLFCQESGKNDGKIVG